MRRHRAFADIQRLIENLEACRELHGKIIGHIKQLPKDWYKSSEQAGYSQEFYSLCENHFKSSMLDKVNLMDFLIACRKLDHD